MNKGLAHWRFGCCGLALLAGCAVGPDYHRPDVSAPVAFSPRAIDLSTAPAGEARQAIAPGAALVAQWWQLFEHRGLNALVQEAVVRNPSVAIAQANLAQAEHLLSAQRGTLLPQLNLAASAGRGKSTINGLGNNTTQRSFGPTLSFDLDVFGAGARRIEQGKALVAYQRVQLAAAQMNLSAQMVLQVLNAAMVREQIEAIEHVIQIGQQNRTATRELLDAGKGTQLDVLTAEQQLALTRTLLPSLRQQLAVAEHAIAVLLGRAPADWTPPAFRLAEFHLPEQLPLALPSDLLRRRPDIVAAELLLQSYNADVGAATAALYPRLSISADWSETKSSLGAFDTTTQVRNLAINLLAPIFDGGTLRAQRDATVDAYASQLGQYRQVTLQAFQEVADLLSTLEQDTAYLAENDAALQSSVNMLDLSRESYKAGVANVLQLLEAQRAHQVSLMGVATARGYRYLHTVQLFVALGGGWPGLSPGAEPAAVAPQNATDRKP